MVKKLNIIVILTFLSLFVYFYYTSGKFRKSIIAAFAATTLYFSVIPPAHSSGSADAFTPKPHHLSRPYHGKRPGKFSGKSSRSSNNPSGPGKPENPGGPNDPDDPGSGSGGNGPPGLPQTEPVEVTKERGDSIRETLEQMKALEKNDKKNQCPLDENKNGFHELPDGKNFSYDMKQGRGLKSQAKKVWNNHQAKKEVLRMLERFDDKDADIQEKSLKGFNSLTELKNSGSGPRIFIYRGRNEQPKVIGFCMRDNLETTLKKLKNKYN